VRHGGGCRRGSETCGGGQPGSTGGGTVPSVDVGGGGAGVFGSSPTDVAGPVMDADSPPDLEHGPQSATPNGLPWDPVELERLAAKVLSPGAATYYAATATYPTSRENERAWQGWRFMPRLARDVSSPTAASNLLGIDVPTPVLLAPCAYAVHAHPDGEFAIARGAAEAGNVYVVSSASSKPPPSVARSAAGPCWLQLYVPRQDAELVAVLAEAEAAGFRAVVVTLDSPALSLRHRGFIPEHVFDDPRARAGAAAELLNPLVTWRTIERIADLTSLPVLVKGILRADDAAEALNHGVRGVVVSNHGGRQLDGVVPTALVLEEVAAAIDHRALVLVDGGIRTGRDVLRALCLGADGVLIGRPYLWALALAGEAGVTELLLRLRLELENAMALTGAKTVADADRGLLRWIEHPPRLRPDDPS